MIKKYALYILLSLISVAVFAEDLSTPTGRVKDSVNKVLTVLKDTSLDRETRWAKIGIVINDSFDFRSMSQSVLATNWKKASPEERQQFVVFFSQYLEDTYRTKIEAYTNQKVEFVGETIRGKKAVVETLIITDNSEIPINYKLKNNDGTWFAYDVVIEGISLVSNYRSTFSAIVKNDGMDGLLNDIQNRVNKYKASQKEEAPKQELSEDS
ncbi:MAG: ABC transporter substrate-binding protein [Proteobacteria bacterium]|nr:ABC transporter substrate-binding protein [Pseudomonadota bacterium]NOG61664.1 ABC transporter substrate-binding protein [Pseudomonadota bacterium]